MLAPKPIKGPSASLPPMDFPFEIQVAGRETKIPFVGKFKYRRPNLGRRGQIDVMRARLNGDLEVLDQEVLDFHEMVSHLRHTIVEFPDWWKESSYGLDLYDGNVVEEVFNKCMAFEKEWKEKVFGGDAKAVGASDENGPPAVDVGATPAS